MFLVLLSLARSGRRRRAVGRQPLWLDDAIHPTQAGYRVIAEAVMRALAG